MAVFVKILYRKTGFLGVRFALSNRKSSVRVRFAPSPTGYLHLGGLRTALYNHLFALSQNGTTILRIEDTDQERKVEGAEEQLISDLAWCGLKYDEGPIRQSERLSLYQKHVQILIETGHAYKCFCTSSRLDILRREAVKASQVPRYDNRCRALSPADVNAKLTKKSPYCVRFKLTSCLQAFHDLVYGEISQDVAALEGDPVILKTDGFPTYHLANVVDDHDMQITHVLRGVEWQGSTQKHLLLYKAFGWTPPLFGHLPLLLNPNGSKLSKRQGDVDVRQYREKRFFPLAVVNFVVRAGGGFDIHHAQMDLRSFTIEELAQKFDLNKIKGSSCKVDLEKLKVSNQLELRRKLFDVNRSADVVSNVRSIVLTHFKNSGFKLDVSDDNINTILHWAQNRIYHIDELVRPEWRFLWVVPNNESPSETDQRIIYHFLIKLNTVDFSSESLKEFCTAYAAENGIKFPTLMKVLRKVLSGLKEGPGVVEMMIILGKVSVTERLQNAVSTYHRHGIASSDRESLR